MHVRKSLILSVVFLFTLLISTTAHADYWYVTDVVEIGGAYNGSGDCGPEDYGHYRAGTKQVTFEVYDCNMNYKYTTWLHFCVGSTPPSTGDIYSNSCDFDPSNFGAHFGRHPSCRTPGKPVDVASGNMYHSFNDFRYGGAGPAISFTRFYNSQATYDGPLGYGWTHNYDVHLDDSTNKVSIRMGDGKYIYFIKQPDLSYRPLYWTKTTLVTSGGYYDWTREDGSVYRFLQSDGTLRYIVKNDGDTLSLSYDANGRLQSVTGPYGQSMNIAYGAVFSRISTISDPAGRTYTYAYTDPDGDLESVTFNDGASEQYSYINHNLTTYTDPNGNATMSWTYDSSTDMCTSSSGYDSENLITLDNYSTYTVVTKYLDGVPSSETTYTYDVKDDVSSVTSITGPGCSECGTSGSFTYDMNDPYIITSYTDENGIRTEYSRFDSQGQPGRVVEAAGTSDERTTDYTYQAATGATASISSRSLLAFGSYTTFRREFAYDSNNRLTKTYVSGCTGDVDYTSGTNPQFFNYSTSKSYNAHNKVTQSTDALGRDTAFSYYSTVWGDPNNGRLASVTNSLGGTVSYGNYSSGQPGWMLSERGALTEYTYDARGRLVSAVTHDSSDTMTRTVRHGYDAFGNMTTSTLASGARIGYEYYPGNRLYKVRDAIGNYVTYTYDSEGNKTLDETRDSSGNLKRYAARRYDSDNRVAAVRTFGSYSTTFGYDAGGNLTSRRAYNGSVSSYYYDSFGRKTLATLPDPGDGSGQVNSIYSYDIADNLIKYVDGNAEKTTGVYDDLGRLLETADAEGKVTHYEYDAAGRLTGVKDPKGNVTTFSYAYGTTQLVVTKTYADSDTEVGTYDSSGLLVSKTNARGATATYSYNDFGELEGVTYSDSTPSVTYHMSAVFSRISTITDAGGDTQYTYDANGRVHTVDGPYANDTVTYTYDAAGMIAQIQQQGADTVSYAYDTDGRLATVTAGTREFAYTYAGGNTVPTRLDMPNGAFVNYSSDNLYRLKSVTSRKSDGSEIAANRYTYNKAHIRTAETATNADLPGFTNELVTYDYNNVNQLTNTSDNGTLTYDDDGNMLTGYAADGTPLTMTYDAENRLTSVTDGTNTAFYYYRFDGFMYKEVVNGTETRFVRGLGYLCLQERNSSNNVTRSYVWDPVSPGGIGGLLEMTQGGSHYCYLYDGKGNVRALIDGNQNVAASYTYSPFGALLSTSGTLDQPYRFSTKRHYDGFGMVYYGYRFYQPSTGRWLTRDPIGIAGGLNLYGFVGNNALNNRDSFGQIAGVLIYPILEALATAAEYTLVTLVTAVGAQTIIDKIKRECKRSKCPPCTPYPEGTVGYKGPHTNHDHYPIKAPNPHLNISIVRQHKAGPKKCKCYWERWKLGITPPPLPGWVDCNSYGTGWPAFSN